MEINIVEKKDQNLYVYHNEELLFYSKLKWNWFKRNVITVFNKNDELVIEFQSYVSFYSTKFKILKQNKEKISDINNIEENVVNIGENVSIKRVIENHFAFNWNFIYRHNGNKIAEVKQKLYGFPQRIFLNIVEENNEFKNAIIIHILAIRTGFSSD